MDPRSLPLVGRLLPSEPSAPLWPIALARVLLGLLWLAALRWKLPPDFDPGLERSIEDWLELAVEHAVIPGYGSIVDALLLPNVTAVSWLVFLVELAVGVSLLLGVFSRTGSLLGLLLSLNLAVAFIAVPGEWPWSYLMLIMWHGTLLVSDPGRLWGFDQVRRRVADITAKATATAAARAATEGADDGESPSTAQADGDEVEAETRPSAAGSEGQPG